MKYGDAKDILYNLLIKKNSLENSPFPITKRNDNVVI